MTCGACCAFYRASFYWAEMDEGGGSVPAHLTVKINDFLGAMKGTQLSQPRCIALEGIIGESVLCNIYEVRSSGCRGFEGSWQNGQRNLRCDKARLAWGLKPLSPDSWIDPKTITQAV